jgi:hypothetical protein
MNGEAAELPIFYILLITFWYEVEMDKRGKLVFLV